MEDRLYLAKSGIMQWKPSRVGTVVSVGYFQICFQAAANGFFFFCPENRIV